MFVKKYLHIHTYMHMYKSIYMHTHIQSRTHIYLSIYLSIYIYIYTHTSRTHSIASRIHNRDKPLRQPAFNHQHSMNVACRIQCTT